MPPGPGTETTAQDAPAEVTPGSARARLWIRLRSDRAALLVHLASLVIAIPAILLVDRHEWFVGDDWDFINRTITGQLHLLTPHNEHWSTIPLLIWVAIEHVVSLRTYLPYLLAMLIFHVITTHLAWRLMRRVGASAWISTAIALVLVVGHQNLNRGFQTSFIGSVGFGLAAILLVCEPDHGRRRLAGAWALMVCGLMCSDNGVGLVAATAMVAWIATGSWRRALVTMSVPTVVYVVWALAEHVTHSETGGSRVDLLSLPDFVWTGLTATVAEVTGAPEIGSIVIIGLAVFVGRRLMQPGRHPEHAAAAGTFLGAVALLTVIGVARVGLGVDQAESQRYIYMVAVLLAPSVAWVVASVPGRRGVIEVVTLAVCCVLVVHGAWRLDTLTRLSTPLTHDVEGITIAAAQVAQHRTLVPELFDNPDLVTGVPVTDLRRLTADHGLPNHAVSVADRLTAEAFLNVDLAADRQVGGAPASLDAVQGSSLLAASDDSGCVTVTADPTQPGVALIAGGTTGYALRLTAAQSLTVSVVLLSGSSRSTANAMTLPGDTGWLNVAAGETALITSPVPSMTVCSG